MDLLLPVFQLVYFIVHFLYSLGQAVLDCFHELYFLLRHLRKEKYFVPDSKRIIADAVQLKKIPRHLGLILNGNQTCNFKNICYLLNWCAGFGISNVSLYDFDGVFKLKLPTLLCNINNICTEQSVKVIVDNQVYETDSESYSGQQSATNKHEKKTADFSDLVIRSYQTASNSNVKSSKTMMYLFCVDDGKDDVVRMVRDASQKQETIFSKEYISDNLSTNDVIDPDLVIVFGRPLCTMGFLPWQVRLTEFINVPSVSRLDYYEFRKLLQIYSKCEQRFGS
ncbi:UNVERIFIED_CONTAM: hypothetical protein RMT77_005132 [Armadillidium vulgare]